MPILPTSLSLKAGNQLIIAWSDGQTRHYSARELRKACPCATCREEREEAEQQAANPANSGGGLSLPVISPQETRPLAIEDMRPVGSYAYAIHFSDGHNTGIFTLNFLREELGEAAAQPE